MANTVLLVRHEQIDRIFYENLLMVVAVALLKSGLAFEREIYVKSQFLSRSEQNRMQ